MYTLNPTIGRKSRKTILTTRRGTRRAISSQIAIKMFSSVLFCTEPQLIKYLPSQNLMNAAVCTLQMEKIVNGRQVTPPKNRWINRNAHPEILKIFLESFIVPLESFDHLTDLRLGKRRIGH